MREYYQNLTHKTHLLDRSSHENFQRRIYQKSCEWKGCTFAIKFISFMRSLHQILQMNITAFLFFFFLFYNEFEYNKWK